MSMNKRCAAALLALLLLLALPAPALAAGRREAEEDAPPVTEIGTAAAFLRFAEGCALESYSLGRRFALTADIDLSGADFAPVPYFAGSFDGRGHLILGLRLEGDGSRQGLFRRVAEGAEIRRLRVRGSVTPGGSRCLVGGVAGENAGLLEDCSFEGRVAGIDRVGGVVGLNTETGVLRGCRFQGSVLGEHQAGGLAGENLGLLSDCENLGSVNAEPLSPSGERRFDLSAFSQEDFLDLADLGGVAGANSGVLDGCVNRGAVGYKYNGYNVGGVAGSSSGYVRGCANHAAVTGRRDVGGVVGQLIPQVSWDFSNGKLEALGGAIGGLNRLLNDLIQSAEDLDAGIRQSLGGMSGSTRTALDALNAALRELADGDRRLLEGVELDPETGQLRFTAAPGSVDLSALTAALGELYARSEALSALTRDSVGSVAEDLKRISSQMSYVMNCLMAVVSGGTGMSQESVDLSADEAYEHELGAVDGCRNTGGVDAEDNAGGVVGTIAFEIAFDREDRLHASDFLLTEARQSLFAVIRDCGSFSQVQARQSCAGGVVGQMGLGAAVACFGSGRVSVGDGDYAGGVAGQARGSLLRCWSRSLLSGGRYVGGAAGLGETIRDCRCWTQLESAREYAGAVAGWAEGEVSGNLYAGDGPAGVDGVARVGQAEPASVSALLALEDAPADFDKLSVRFRKDGRILQTLELPFGGSVEALPEVPMRGEQYWKWDEFDREHIYYSMTIDGKYYAPDTTISSGEELPLFLVEGLFYEGQELRVASVSAAPEGEETLLGAWSLYVNDYEGELTVRMRAEEDGELYSLEDGGRSRIPSSRDGQYLVFRVGNGQAFALVRRQASPLWQPYVWGGGALLLTAALWLLLRRRGRARRAASAAQPPLA